MQILVLKLRHDPDFKSYYLCNSDLAPRLRTIKEKKRNNMDEDEDLKSNLFYFIPKPRSQVRTFPY